jgi:hypothetical protein
MTVYARAAVLAVLRQRGWSKTHALAAIREAGEAYSSGMAGTLPRLVMYPISPMVDGYQAEAPIVIRLSRSATLIRAPRPRREVAI